MGRRSVLLVAAVVLAGLGATLVFLYARGADQRAAQGLALRQVLVATVEIPTGTTGASLIGSSSVELRKVAVEREWPILDFAKPVAMREQATKRQAVAAGGAVALGAVALGITWYARRRGMRA